MKPDSLPFSAEAEMGVLSSMLLGGDDVIGDVHLVLEPDAFFVPRHQTVFGAITAARAKGIPLDMITFTQKLRDDGVLNAIGGPGFVAELCTYVPTAANVDYYVETVREKWMRRQMINRATTAIRQARDETTDTEAVLEEFQANIIEIGRVANVREPLRPIAETVPDVLASIEATYRCRGQPIGISTGFIDLDRMTGGFQEGRTYYVAARPAMGKSSLATEFAEHVAIDNAERKHPVAIFSVEMTAHELTEVILCRRSEIDLVKLRDGFFSKEERAKVDQQAAEVCGAPIYIDDQGDLSIFEFRARARRAVRKLNVELIIIDYIQRMKSTTKRAQINREQEINEIAQAISATAKELQVPIVVLAQLNRETEKRVDGRPELSHLRESGSMEAEAHFVGLLYRPSYYAKDEQHLAAMARERNLPVKEFLSYTEFIIAKQRRGPVGTVRLRFTKEYARFQGENEHRPLYSNRPGQQQPKEKPSFLAEVTKVFPTSSMN